MKRSPMKRGTVALKRSAMPKLTRSMSRGRPKPKKRAKRAKMPTRKSLVNKADSLVSQIVRLRDRKCVECGSIEKLTNGHVLSRRSYSTRWDFTNCYAQCWPCNFKAAMTSAASYHAWYVRTFGADSFDRLYRLWEGGRKWSRLELIELVGTLKIDLAVYEKEAND